MSPAVAVVPVFAEWPMPESIEGSQTKPSYSVGTDTVTDNVTGLVWQRTPPALYEGCTGHYIISSKGPPGDACFWDEAKRYCASSALSASLGGLGWRLPAKIELESIQYDADHYTPSEVFPQAGASGYFWTGSRSADSVDSVWLVGNDSKIVKNPSSNYVRCVRSQGAVVPAKSAGEHYAISEGTVTDRSTTLTWQQSAEKTSNNYGDAKVYCQNLVLDGGGWRLPGLRELLTLVDPTRVEPAFDPLAFPNRRPGAWYFWTASPLGSGDREWLVDFRTGETVNQSPDGTPTVRCVR